MSELKNDRFLRALLKQPVDYTPVWMMRQAGRYLPEYKATRARAGSFMDLCKNPELACEVTIQPLERFPLDAAILFSDILTVPDAMGLELRFAEGEGPIFDKPVRSEADVKRLPVTDPHAELQYVMDAVSTIRKELDGRVPLIGFAGSPWTLATYMVEGGSSRHYRRCKELFYTERPLFDRLMEKITASLIEYFQMQIDAGVDCIQIFDSWGGVLTPDAFEDASVRWMREIVSAIGDDIPTIVFSKGMHEHTDALVSTGADVLGVSWTTRLSDVSNKLPDNIGVQGNLDPVLINTTPEIVDREAKKILTDMKGHTGHIFNLGHGIMPQAKIECMAQLVETVSTFEP